MSELRFKAISEALNTSNIKVEEQGRRSALFGTHVFNEDRMLQYLTRDALRSVKDAAESGTKINRKTADQVAEAMKAWAISLGATHYTHWFQPLTGATAEKHDAFFDLLSDG
ncbi:MAG: glutamine synthetase III, partial [Flavobacteriaceae bacterium]